MLIVHRPAVRLTLALGLLIHALAAAANEPLEVLRENVARGIEILQDPRYLDASQKGAQRERLCEVAHEMFDPMLFSRLALGENWARFSEAEQAEFVDAFAAYLCTYYLAKLQERYSNESVEFLGQEYRNEALALVRVEVDWQQKRVPIEIRMARREGRWKAFDAVVMGVSALLVYRTQLDDALNAGSPADLIRDLRVRVASADG